MAKYKYLEELIDGETTRKRSKRQESNIAKVLRGKTTINSGATLSQNDVVTDYCEVEAKTTANKSYSITLKEWFKMLKRCRAGKMPVFIVTFETEKKSLAVIDYDDLQFLIEMANRK
jgi:hypothetical protein